MPDWQDDDMTVMIGIAETSPETAPEAGIGVTAWCVTAHGRNRLHVIHRAGAPGAGRV